MIINGQRVKVIVDHRNKVSEKTVTRILQHIKSRLSFVLVTKDNSMLILFDPSRLCYTANPGGFRQETDVESFIDAVKLSLIEYPKFISFDKLIASQQKLIK